MQLDRQIEAMVLRLYREAERASAPVALVLRDATEALLQALDTLAAFDRRPASPSE